MTGKRPTYDIFNVGLNLRKSSSRGCYYYTICTSKFKENRGTYGFNCQDWSIVLCGFPAYSGYASKHLKCRVGQYFVCQLLKTYVFTYVIILKIWRSLQRKIKF